MRKVVPGRRGFLQRLTGVLLAAVAARPAAADTGARPATGAAETWDYRWREDLRSPNAVPRPTGIPAEFVPVGDHRKHKTQHWVRPRDWPLGPAVQSRGGKIISVDFMIAKADFDRGFSWSLAIPEELGRHRIDHVDIDLVPAGHTGFETPHYDVHLYFITHGEHGACEV